LKQLCASCISISDLVLFVLNQYHDPTHPVLRDLVKNAASIAAALYYHPATSQSISVWAHSIMCARYSQAIQDLAKAEQGWHFGAMHTQLEQLRDFKIEDMANTMQMVAPELWSLVLGL
ncbi:hypothetical protein BD310DRAFT_797580, partial [Dichomitus squalens]